MGSPSPILEPGPRLESVLRTEELGRRPTRPPDYEAENQSLVTLTRALADSPQTILQRLVEVARETCRAGSAGLSLLNPADGGESFYWPAIAGAWQPNTGGGMPRDASPCGVVLDRDSVQLFVRPERFFTYLVPIEAPIREALLSPFYLDGQAVGTVWVVAHEDGRHFDREDERRLVTLGRFASAAYRAWLAVTTAEQRAGALLDSERRLREIIDSLPAAVYTTDADGLLTHFNPACVRLSGRTPVLGTDRWCVTWKLYREDGSPMPLEQCGMARALRQGRAPGGIAAIAERPDGTRVWLRAFPAPLHDGSGRVVGGINMLLDVTEAKRAEDDLREADRRKDEFLATLAHELRNPLAPVRNAVHYLQVHGPPAPDLVRARSVLERQVGLMARLLDDLLDLARISRNRLELRRTTVELAEILHGAEETSRPAIEQRGHELTVALPGEPVYLDGDPVRLSQVFMNLLTNAAKYTPPGGRIEVRAGREGRAVVVRVRDTGVGIPADKLPRLFEIFYQVDHSLDRSQGGLGIGLSLVKRLVDLHGGSVTAHSDGPGRGSEFVVRLPVADPPPTPTPAGRPPEPAAGPERPIPPRRILVADDNHDSADTLAMVLRLNGHEVETAYDGLDCVTRAEAFRPDVLLLDIGMPKLDGYEVCRRIREQPWGRDATLIALTGWSQEADRRRSEEAGFDAHLIKPVDYAELTKLLQVSRG